MARHTKNLTISHGLMMISIPTRGVRLAQLVEQKDDVRCANLTNIADYFNMAFRYD